MFDFFLTEFNMHGNVDLYQMCLNTAFRILGENKKTHAVISEIVSSCKHWIIQNLNYLI